MFCYNLNMNTEYKIARPKNESDTAGAERVLKDFIGLYQPSLIQAEQHLSKLLASVEPAYAVAYKPWQSALTDIIEGLQLMARRITLKDAQRFMDALLMFTFEGAIQFLQDLCKGSKLELEKDWAQKFKEHIDMLLFSIAILNKQLAPALAR